MKKTLYGLSFLPLLVGITFATSTGDNIIITEVEYDPATPAGHTSSEVENEAEWFELYNPTGNPIDIGNWTIKEGGSPTYTFPSPTIIASGDYLLVTNRIDRFQLNYPGITPDLEMNLGGTGLLRLNNGGDELTLKDSGGITIDFVAWENYIAGWSATANAGETVCRTISTDTDLSTDWNGCPTPNPGSGSLTVIVTNNTPTDIQIDGGNTDSINENQAIGTNIGSLTTTDLDSGDTYLYSLSCSTVGADDGKFQISGTNLQTNFVFDYETNTDSNADGIYEVCVKTDDQNGGIYEETLTITINDLDDTPPTTPLTSPDLQSGSDSGGSNTDNNTNNTTPTIDITCTEIGSTITLYVDGVSTQTHTCTSIGTESITLSTPLLGGNYGLTYTETDTSSNQSVSSPVLNITIDTTDPIIAITAPTKLANTSITNTTILITDDIQIDASDITITAINTTGAFGISNINCAQTSTVQVNCTLQINDAEGTGDIQVQAIDKAGNASTETETNYKIDKTAPTPPTCTTIPTPANNGTSVTTTCTGVESGATVTIPNMTCGTESGNQVTCTGTVGSGSGFIQTANDGISIVDILGNLDMTETTHLQIDNTAPTLIINTPTNGSEVPKTTNISITCTTVGDTITITNSNITPNPATYTCLGTETTNVPITFSAGLEGTNQTLNITSTDTLGNVSAIQTLNLFIADGDNVSPSVEDGAPNSGDGNNDGILDSIQTNVVSFLNTQNTQYNTLEVGGGTCTKITNIISQKEPNLSVQDPSNDYPIGLWDMTFECSSVGATANISIYLDQVYDTTSWVYKKYNQTTHTYTDISNIVTYGTKTIGGQEVTKISYAITDGGANDEDGVANGIIIDPAGPSIPVITTGSGSTVSGGGAPTRHVIYMCDKKTGKCDNIFPTQNKGSREYQTYLDCYRKGSDTGLNCATTWALSVGYAKPENFIEKTEKPIITKIKDKVVDFFVPQKVKSKSKNVCEERVFTRYPERRGHGIADQNLFSDASEDHPAYEALIDLAEQKIVAGDADTGNARLDDTLNRAEFVKLITIAREDHIKTGSCSQRANFPDVRRGSWYHDFVQNMQAQKIVEGYPDGYYRPEKEINFAEAYKIMALSFGYITAQDAKDESKKEGTTWYQPYANALVKSSVIPSSFNQYKASDKIPRGEAFQLLSNILKEVDSR